MIRDFYLRAKKVPYAILAAVLFFLALEAAVRAGLHVYGLIRYHENISALKEANLQASAETGWQWEKARTFRGRENIGEKPPGLFRIIATGDSCCWGALVPADFTFSAVLEKLLREKYGAGRVEVLNAGVVGYGSAQVTALIRTTLAAYRPDLIVYYGAGENAAVYTRGTPGAVKGWPGNALPFLARSRAYLLLNQVIRSMRPQPEPGQIVEQDEKITEMDAAAREAGARLLLTEYVINYRGILTSDLVGREAEFSLPLVRTYDAFLATGLPVSRLMFDRVHPTAAGHKIIAERLASEILRLNFIPK